MDENVLERALYSRLSEGAALIAALGGTAIYSGFIPAGSALPAIVFSLASGVDENMTPTRSARYVYLVKAVARSMGQAGTLSALVDDLLHNQLLTIENGVNFWTMRETVVRYQEMDPTGQIISHAGGEYVIRTEDGSG